jgi:hypothetical protein
MNRPQNPIDEYIGQNLTLALRGNDLERVGKAAKMYADGHMIVWGQTNGYGFYNESKTGAASRRKPLLNKPFIMELWHEQEKSVLASAQDRGFPEGYGRLSSHALTLLRCLVDAETLGTRKDAITRDAVAVGALNAIEHFAEMLDTRCQQLKDNSSGKGDGTPPRPR